MTEPSQYFKGRTVQEQMNEVIGYVDTRSAEVAVNAIAADVAQVHQDMLDADADAAAAAASATAAAGTLANAVKKTGEASQSIAGDIAVAGDLSGGTVTVPTPVNNTDAASKKYVDDQDALDAKLTGATFTGQLNASGQRAYSPGNTTDVATIGTVDAYKPMVRTTGDQNIRGIKSINQAVINCLSSSKAASTPFLLYKHSKASTTQDYRGYLLVTKTNPPVAELIHLQYNVNADTNAVTMSPNCRVQVIDGDSTNTSTYSVFVDNDGLVNVAITSGTGQAVSCMVLQMWVGARYGVTSDMSAQGTETTIPTNHGEVTL